MNEKHITDILDNTPFESLSATELESIRGHVSICRGCARSFEAAQLSQLLMKQRTATAAESAAQANPFFQTRVMAAWREQQAANRMPAFRRFWNTTSGLVASMAATTAAFAVLTFMAPASDTTSQQTAAVVPYSAETFVLDQDEDNNQLTNDQVLNAVYVDEDEGK